jgi:uncharacterized protein
MIRPFHLMAKPTGFQCNIACDYCFYVGKGAGTLKQNKPQRHMDDATLVAYIRSYIVANPAAEIEFSWQGGEPTLAGLAFFRKVVALQAAHARGKTIRNTIQTNGLLIDKAWAEFLAENRVLVGLSIDGPPQLHDLHRRSRTGRGMSEGVLRALDLLKKHCIEYNILAVVNATTAQHPLDVYRYLTGTLGAEFLQFIPVVERAGAAAGGEVLYPQSADTAAKVTDWSVSGEDYGRFLIAVFDEWVRQDVGRVFVQIFDNALAAWCGEPLSFCVMRPTCGSCLVIEMNGDIYSCDHYVYPEHRLGNVKRDDLAALVSGKKQKRFGIAKADLPRLCMQCTWRFVCQGGCPKHRIHCLDGKWHNCLCAGYQAIFAHMDPYMRFMTERLRNRQPPADVMRVAPLIAGTLSFPHGATPAA